MENYLGFFRKLNDSLHPVRQITFDIGTLKVLKKILQELSKLEYVEEVRIFFYSKPDYFCDKTISAEEYRNLFPPTMKNISKIVILPYDDQDKILKHFPTILPPNLPYCVQFEDYRKFNTEPLFFRLFHKQIINESR